MELALYCPNFGYYEQTDAAPGHAGDFYTSVSVGGLFGELLAAQFANWLDAMPASQPRQLVEAGAHDGQLAADIWQWLKTHRPDLAGSLEYWIIEPSARRKDSQQKKLNGICEKVRWFKSWKDLPDNTISGVIFSNELLDAMPVHRLGWDAKKQQWFEWGVATAGEEFVWEKLAEMESKKTPEHLPPELLEILRDGFTTEYSPYALEWWSGAAKALKSGKLLTFDYGLNAEEFFMLQRRAGTLRAYFKHRQSNELLANAGEQDLTAQVNFSAILDCGETNGLKTEFFGSQERFLTGVLKANLETNPAFKHWDAHRSRQFQTLTHPQHLGHSFKVLVQGR